MPNTVQLTQNGQPVYPVTDVSLITGLEERSGMRVIPYTTLPTASAETAGFIYMDESTKDLYITKATSGSYSWVSAGNLSNINLDNYATKDEVSQLGQEIYKLTIPSVVNKSVTTGSTIGATLTLAYNNESGYRCAIYDCSPGDVFVVNGKGGNSTRLWGFVDTDNKLLAVSAGGATGNNTRIVAPANAVKFIWNSSTAATSYYEKKDSLPYLEERVSAVETETAQHSEQLVFKNYTDGKSTSSGGTISDYTGRLITDKIPCTAGDTVYFYGAVQYVLAYDSSGAFLASRSFNYLFWTLPTDTAYIIVCFPSTLGDATVYKNNSIVWKKTLSPDTLLGIQNEIIPQGERLSSVEIGVADSIGQLFEEYSIPYVGERTYNVESNGKLGTPTSYRHRCVKVSPGDVLHFKNTNMYRDLYVAFLSSYTYTVSSGADLPLVTGTSCKPICLIGTNGSRILSEVSYVVPEGCVAVAFGQYSNVSPNVTLRIERANPVPNYYRQYISDKSFAVRKRDIQLGQNADSFIFFTDYHIAFPLTGGITTNFQHSPALIDYVREHTNTKKILFGGDVFNSPSNDTERFELMDAFLNQFKFAPYMFTAVGNHEWRQSSDLSNDGRTYDFGSLAKTLEGIVTFGRDANGDITQPYYYFDNPSLKVRYFVLYAPGTVENSSYAVFNYAEQLAFVESETANLDASWKVVIVQHIVYENGTPGTSVYDADNFPTKLSITAVGTAIKSAIVTHNQTAQAKIVGLFCGHVHNEFLEFVDGHCIAVCQNCDATFTRYNGSNDVVFPNQTVRNYGTTDEQSFDVYHLDFTNKKLYDIKVGYGADKVVNITEQTVSVGNTITLTPSITPDSWVSQNENVATVASGVVTGVAAGRVTIKARENGTPNGKWEYYNILVQ